MYHGFGSVVSVPKSVLFDHRKLSVKSLKQIARSLNDSVNYLKDSVNYLNNSVNYLFD